MAHIKKLTDKPRTLPWRAQIRRKGHPVMVKMFKTKAEAEHWANEQERTIRLTGLPLTIGDLKEHTLGDIVRRYLAEITPTKGCRVSETAVLNKLLRHEICKKALAYVSRQDAYKYRDERLNEIRKGKKIQPSTVRREFNTIQHVFEVTREQWGFTNLQNPFRSIAIKGSNIRRDRRLDAGELTRLERACQECRGLNRYYVPLAFHLAIETGMRLQEIFNLKHQDIDILNRRIIIRKSKTDHLTGIVGRTIVLTIGAHWYLTRLLLVSSHVPQGEVKGKARSGYLFPMSPQAFQQSWADVCKRAKIEGLHFHDLRREAGSRFHEADLTKPEHDLMLGHKNRDMTSLYIRADLNRIQDKLDRDALDGLTLKEWTEKYDETAHITGCPPLIFQHRPGEQLDGSLVSQKLVEQDEERYQAVSG
jgi:integrase